MTTIGYATLQIVPSLKGVSDSVNKQLASMPEMGTAAGKKLGSGIAAGVRGSEAQLSAALSQAVNSRGAEKAGQAWADSTASSMAKHLQSAQNSQKLQSSLTYLVKNGDAAGKKFAQDMASKLAIELPIQTRAQQIGEKVGSVVGKGIGAGIKLGIAGVAGTVALAVGGVGIALSKGFDRLKAIDDAQFKLKALGHSAAETKQIMDNALASVKGTAFGLEDAATAAAAAVAAGIKPGQDLTKYLGEVGDAAAVAGTNFGDMAHIFDKIQTQNKAYTGDLQELSDRGLPIFQWLQKEYGVTADALTKMVQKGEVDSAHFQEAINKNIGGAALKMGQSFDGAVQNMEASVARLGANFITAILGGDPNNALQGPTQAIEKLTGKFDDIGVWVNAHSTEIRGFFVDIKDYAVEAARAVKSIGEFLLEHKGIIEASAGVWLGWKAISVVAGVATSVKAISAGLAGLGGAAEVGGAGAVAGLSPLVGFLAANPVIAALIAGTAFGAGIGPLLNAGPDARNQKLIDDYNNKQRDNAEHNRVPAVLGPSLDPNAPIGPGITPKPLPGPQLPVSPPTTITVDPRNPLLYPYHRATGGAIFGAGSATSDSIPAWLSKGEHVWTAAEVVAAGGQSAMYRMRAAVRRFSGGGDLGINPHPMGHIGRGVNAYDANKPTGGGNFNPNMLIDTSTTTYSGAPKFWESDKDSFLFGDIAKHGIGGGKIGKGIPFHKRRFDPYVGHLGRNIWGFSGGGAVGPDVTAAENLVGTPYSTGKRFDCSGDVARVINAALGLPGGDLMTTMSASQWLSARGFKPGLGGPGAISVGWKNGGPGGGHMAMTLSDGRNAEGGGSHPNFLVGAGAAGASSAQFTDHMYLALAAASAVAGAGNDASGTGQGDSSAAPTAGSSSSGGAGALPSSISGLSAFGLSGLGSGVGTTGSGSDLSLFGNAAGAAVSGQVASALGVFGAGDSPGWLNAATQLVGGLKVGGHGHPGQSDGSIFNGANPLGSFGQGQSAAPLSATSTATGTPPPDNAGNVHGTRAGQAPGPQVVYNIRTATVDDAFLAAQRKQDERYAAKLSRY